MRYFEDKNQLIFHRAPTHFNKYTHRSVLQYAIGANMYMPATKSGVSEKLLKGAYKGIGAITFCLEDSIAEPEVKSGEENVRRILCDLYSKGGYVDLPLLFIRVRDIEQAERFCATLTEKETDVLTGLVFPKVESATVTAYFKMLKKLIERTGNSLYCMPILESSILMKKRFRDAELYSLRTVFDAYQELILNIRVGGTDFSSMFGLRRNINQTIYDLKVVSDCLTDIINTFAIGDTYYVISGPVWEYFSCDKNSQESIGLLKELSLDMANGFQGKTVIHPTQVNLVNESYIVPYSTYCDALKIVNSDGGVFKSEDGNQMCEVSPHKRWAQKILARAEIFGVYDKSHNYIIY